MMNVWEVRLMKLLAVLSYAEGTWYEGIWERYGLNAHDKQEIEAAWAKWQKGPQ